VTDTPELPPLPAWAEAMLPGNEPQSVNPEPPVVNPEPPVVNLEPAPVNGNTLTMTPVTSSNIAAVGHDGSALYVQFQNGGLYRYPSVGADHHAALLSASSPGQYFHQKVKSTHKGERVT
jgi:hypothetical protein